MNFKENFAKFTQPGPQREKFVLNTLINLPKEEVVKNLKPITVTKPNGIKITYEIMPDYITVDGIRVPMSGETAQKVADHFGMNLPTPKIVDEIYQNADIKVPAKPLSGSGTNVDGKQYSGNDVVQIGVGYAPFAINYNDKINQQLSQMGYKGDEIVAGFAKDIVPPIKGTLGLYGLYDANGKPIQGGSGQTPHDTKYHTEYGTFVRLISPQAIITYPNGKTEKKQLNEIYQYARYTPAPTKNNESQIAEYNPNKPQSGRMQLIERIDKILSSFKV